MNRIVMASRLLLGLIFVVFGFDGILHFLPMPPMPPAANGVIAVLVSYRLFYVVKVLEISAALLLLSGRYVTLATAVLAPIVFNIVWFDLNLAPATLPMALLLVVLEGVLIWQHRASFRALLRPA